MECLFKKWITRASAWEENNNTNNNSKDNTDKGKSGKKPDIDIYL